MLFLTNLQTPPSPPLPLLSPNSCRKLSIIDINGVLSLYDLVRHKLYTYEWGEIEEHFYGEMHTLDSVVSHCSQEKRNPDGSQGERLALERKDVWDLKWAEVRQQ